MHAWKNATISRHHDERHKQLPSAEFIVGHGKGVGISIEVSKYNEISVVHLFFCRLLGAELGATVASAAKCAINQRTFSSSAAQFVHSPYPRPIIILSVRRVVWSASGLPNEVRRRQRFTWTMSDIATFPRSSHSRHHHK